MASSNRLGVGTIVNVHVVALERFDEGLGHTVRLRAPDRREARYETEADGKVDRIVGAVAAAVIGQPLDGLQDALRAEAPLDAFDHQVAEHLAADAVGRCAPSHDFPVTGIEGERDSHRLAVPAGDLEAVRRPTQVGADRDDSAVVDASYERRRLRPGIQARRRQLRECR